MRRLYLVDDGYLWDDGELKHMWWAQEVTDSCVYGCHTGMFESKEDLMEYLKKNGGNFDSIGSDEDGCR